nr:RNA-directed DNA polymerase, eukaryota [Tanacetum cinerariifolium]
MSMVRDIQLVPMADRWSWTLFISGDFSMSSVRRLIDDKTLPNDPLKTRWLRFVPIKINVIAWKVKSNSFPSRFNISRRGIPLDFINCGICDLGVETVSHIFFTCDLARQLSILIARWWCVPFVRIDSYAEWLTWLNSLRLPSKNKMMLEGVFYIMWCNVLQMPQPALIGGSMADLWVDRRQRQGIASIFSQVSKSCDDFKSAID